jgi:hypothetical protein
MERMKAVLERDALVQIHKSVFWKSNLSFARQLPFAVYSLFKKLSLILKKKKLCTLA